MNAVSNPTNLPVEAFDLSAFVRGLTHEVANPLNAIAMNCELLRMIAGRGEPERVVEAVERILKVVPASNPAAATEENISALLRAALFGDEPTVRSAVPAGAGAVSGGEAK